MPLPSRSTLRRALLGAAALLFALPVRAEGEVVGLPFRLGVFGGWHFTSADIDVSGEREPDLVPGAGPHLGLRLGWRVVEDFALELEAGLVLASVERGDAGVQLLPVHLMAVWRPSEGGDLTPVLGVGAGVIAQLDGAAGGDVDLLLAAMAGVEVRLGGPVALRLTGGVHATDGVDATLSWTPVVSLGLDFKTFSDRRSVVAPEVSDERLLPVRPGRVVPTAPVTPAGCPAGVAVALCKDTDGDGRIDAFDRCPVDAGPGAADGCPDLDGDGLPDVDDACPRTRGEVSRFGCPGPR